jgi:hypothetical protein
VSYQYFLPAYIDNLSKKINRRSNNVQVQSTTMGEATVSQEHTYRFAAVMGLLMAGLVLQCLADETGGVFQESFDSLTPPTLPEGWRSSQKRSTGTNDWISTGSTAFSPPGAILVTNATMEQWLSSPLINCSGLNPDKLQMTVRRSATFLANVAVESSMDSGKTFSSPFCTIGKEVGLGAYQMVEIPVPASLAASAAVVLRWRVVPEPTGATGTFRMDDIRITSATTSGEPGDSLALNEIMYTPRPGEPEWIELSNPGSRSVDLLGWSLSDAAVTAKHTIATASSLLLPGELIVVTSDTAALSAQRGAIDSRCLQSVGFPSLNNGGDMIHLLSPSGVCKDSVGYQDSWGGRMGVSLERIDDLGPSNDSKNWTSSEDSAGATPGRSNSVCRRQHDICATHVEFQGRCDNTVCDISITVGNTGRIAVSQWSIRLSDDVDRDSVADQSETLDLLPGSSTIEPGDSLTQLYEWIHPIPGRHTIIAEAVLEEDERHSNDETLATIAIPFLGRSVRINEIMFDPLAGMPEFVELINSSNSPVDLDGCSLSDRPTAGGSTNRWRLSGSALRVPRSGFLVLVGDSSGPSWFPSLRSGFSGVMVDVKSSGLGLNNDEDAVVLTSADGRLLDSVAYTSSLHTPDIEDTKGRSLELINPVLDGNNRTSWGTCVDPSGGTPGFRNSLSVNVLPSAAAINPAPNPFSPDGDGVDDVTVMSYSLPARSSLVRVRVFDVRGRLQRQLTNIAPSGCAGEIVWDGRTDQGQRARVGAYIVMLEAIDGAGGVWFTARCVVVLAARL